MSIDFDRFWQHVAAQSRTREHGLHGVGHWRRVERNGLLLASRTPGADATVVRLFALFHDSCRLDDGTDAQHGARAAEYAVSLRGQLFDLPDAAFALLHYACAWHTDGLCHENPTIGACWDADRLDLGRVGVIPDERFMSTAFGREIARAGSIQPFLAEPPR